MRFFILSIVLCLSISCSVQEARQDAGSQDGEAQLTYPMLINKMNRWDVVFVNGLMQWVKSSYGDKVKYVRINDDSPGIAILGFKELDRKFPNYGPIEASHSNFTRAAFVSGQWVSLDGLSESDVESVIQALEAVDKVYSSLRSNLSKDHAVVDNNWPWAEAR